MIWYSSTIKSLRRQGTWVTSEAISRFRRLPWKKGSSVRTDSAAAPADSSSRASTAGSNSARIRPFDGEAFFNSAMMAGPEAAARRSPAAKPRGVCAEARRSSSGTGTLALRRSRSARVWARMRSRCRMAGSPGCRQLQYKSPDICHSALLTFGTAAAARRAGCWFCQEAL